MWLRLALLAVAFTPSLAHAQAIDRGREADVLRLLLPYVDDGPVGDGKLTRIAIRPDAIELDVVDAQGNVGSLKLTPRPRADTQPGSASFRMDLPPAPTPQLGQAQQLLRAAIIHNDGGTFFAGAAALPAKALKPPPTMDAEKLAAALSWAGALWLVLLALLAWHLWLDRAPVKWLFWLTFALMAALVRRQVPFVPLHANGHGFEEILIAIGDPDSRAATGRFVAQYGATWLVPLRALTRWIGQSHDQLAIVSSALGGLAAAFGTAAAWRLSRQWLWTALAAALLVFAPVSMRVGHSESAFVVAQLLVSLALWLATHPPRRATLPLLVTLALLALGHPIGIGLAVGVYLLVLAMAMDGADLAIADWRPAQHLLLVAGLGVAVALELSGSRTGVADRLTYDARFHLPVPTMPHEYWLWLQAGYAPRMAVLAGLLGLWSFGRGRVGGMRWVTLATAVAGVGLVAVAGLMVTACATDGLRYQAPFAPVLALLITRAGQGLSAPLQNRMLAVVLWVGIAYGFTDLRAGRRLDAQGQSYQDLRESLQGLSGDVWLAAPDRAEGHERVVVQMPAGRLSAGGVTLRGLLVDDVRDACKAGTPLPKQSFVWFDHACSGRVPAGSPPPCETLQPLAGETIRQFEIAPLPRVNAEGMSGEFNLYPPGALELRLARLRCP